MIFHIQQHKYKHEMENKWNESQNIILIKISPSGTTVFHVGKDFAD